MGCGRYNYTVFVSKLYWLIFLESKLIVNLLLDIELGCVVTSFTNIKSDTFTVKAKSSIKIMLQKICTWSSFRPIFQPTWLLFMTIQLISVRDYPVKLPLWRFFLKIARFWSFNVTHRQILNTLVGMQPYVVFCVDCLTETTLSLRSRQTAKNTTAQKQKSVFLTRGTQSSISYIRDDIPKIIDALFR